LVDLNYNLECDWLIELSNNKLSDNNLASELVENGSFFKPITVKEIVIFMIIIITTTITTSHGSLNAYKVLLHKNPNQKALI